MKEKEDQKESAGEDSTGVPCYVAVLTRGIPVEGIMSDTCTKIIKPSDTLENLLAWQNEMCKGQAFSIKLEITKAT